MVRTSDFRKSRRVRNFDSLKSFGTSRTNASPSVQTAVVIFTVVRKAQSVSLCVLLVSVITTILPRTWAPTVRRRRCDYRTYGIASDVISRRFNDKCDLAHSDRPRDEHTRRIRARAHAHNVVHVIRRTHTRVHATHGCLLQNPNRTPIVHYVLAVSGADGAAQLCVYPDDSHRSLLFSKSHATYSRPTLLNMCDVRVCHNELHYRCSIDHRVG